MNGHWYYPERLPDGDENPYRGRCHNCGSVEFCAGIISTVSVLRLEREGWWPIIHFVPQGEIPGDPRVRGNVFVL